MTTSSVLVRSVFTLLLTVCLAGNGFGQPPAAELLRNGTFEGGSGPDGKGAGVPRWDAVDAGYDIDRNVHHGGDQSVRCDNLRPTGRRGAACRVELNQSTPTAILVTGWSKADAVSGAANTDYSLYIDVEYTDGSTLWGQSTPFHVGTHDWERRRVVIFPTKPIKSMTVNGLFRNHSGSAWFDDFSAHAVEGEGLFDSQVLRVPQRAKAPGKIVTVTAKDGLAITMDSRASITSVRGAGAELSGPLPGGFYVRDVAADGQPVAANGAANVYHGTGADFFSSPTGLDVGFYAKIVPDGDSLLVDGELTDKRNTDRAVTVYLALPVAADGWSWGQDIRRSTPISARRENANLTRVNVGATGGLSLYPFGVVSGPSHAVGIASQMDWPSVHRIFYNGPMRQLVIAWDFALTGKTAAWPSHNARFRCRVFHFGAGQAQWGFRAAASRFYEMNRPNFDRKAKLDGIWLPFTNPSTVTNVEDFGVAYHEGDTSVADDDKRGILSFRYTEPMSWWMPMPPEMPRTYDSALALAKQLSESKDPAKHELNQMARALFSSGTQDPSGKYNIEFRNEPWANGAVFTLNPNPELPSGPNKPTRASVAYTVADAIRRYGAEYSRTHGVLDGEYLDSLEGWSDVLDYRPSSLQASPYPIPFETDTRQPALPEWYSTHTFTRFLRDDLHNRGKLLFANSVPIRFSIYAPLLDIMGIEVNWIDPAGKWRPESDEVLSMRRTLSNQKPYLLLQNTNFDKFDPPLVEKYFQRCLFYAIFPSMFSADAATKVYWDTPALYNRDRPLFKTYIPMIKRLSAAGWEPITHASSDNPKVYVERYGQRLFTLLNDTSTQQSATVAIDLSALKLSGTAIRAFDVKTNVGVKSRIEGAILRLELELQSDQSLAIELR
jgi:hypothetical protein